MINNYRLLMRKWARYIFIFFGVLILVWIVMQVKSVADTSKSPYLFGVINNQSQHYADEWARGVRATTLELHWMFYEPQEGVIDMDYVRLKQHTLAELKAMGWKVQLIPGYNYVPDWVFTTYPDMYYVNQYGKRYDPDFAAEGGAQVINAPFNPQARELIAGYLARVWKDFNLDDFDSVRLGGGPLGELRYPRPDFHGYSNSYWAFDRYAQNPAISGIPGEVMGWRPGIDPNPGSVGRGQLIVNPSFEHTHLYYPIPAWSPEEQVIAQLTSGRNGDRALKLTISTPHRIHQYVRVEPNTTYHFGGWLRSDENKKSARLFLIQIDANHQPLSDFGQLETNSNEWRYLSGELTTHSHTQYLMVQMDGNQAGTYYFDDLWLTRAGETNKQNRDIVVPIAFYDWYVQKMIDYQNWQIAEVRDHYDGQIDMTYAGKGVLPMQVTDALTNDLQGDIWSETNPGLYSAATYDRHVAGLSTSKNIALYLTGVEDPPPDLVDDRSPDPFRWSAARWFAHLAQSRELSVWGENSGQDNVEDLKVAAERMVANNFLGLMWGFESELYDPKGQYVTIDDYHALIIDYSSFDPIKSPKVYIYK
ncbi:MAG: carbohydrate binding domain-containing protein [Ardenticatenaceae bacterium]